MQLSNIWTLDAFETLLYHLKTGGTRAVGYTLIDYLELCPEHILFNTWGFKRPTQCDFQPYMAYIPVDEINYRDRFPFPDWGENAIIGKGSGSWDKLRQPIEHDRRYRSLKDYFNDEVSWGETYLHQKANRSIKKKGHYRGISDPSQVKSRYELLYQSLKEDGYMSQEELFRKNSDQTTSESISSPPSPYTTSIGRFRVPDEICVAIGRNGEIIRTTGGMNRLSIAKILGLEDLIPVIIQIIHSKWDGTCEFEVERLSLDHPLMAK